MIYLDNAATSFPKPPSVAEEMKKCISSYCGNPGRGAHALALAAANKIYDCRELLCETFGASAPERVFFVSNTTYGLNAVIKGLIKDGDHVIISDIEHNAVWRPIYKLAREGRVSYDVFKTLTGRPEQSAWRICANIAKLIRPNTRLVICAHASNICSATLPIAEIGAFCKKHGLLFAVDAAQSAGHINIDVKKMNIDALCLPGHKGLYGPQGSGAVILGDNVIMDTFAQGGNGLDSLEGEMSTLSPERYEAGTLSTPSIVGLCEGIKEVRRVGIEEIAHREQQIALRISEHLQNIDRVEVYAPQYSGSVILFNYKGIPSERIAQMLDERGVCVRGGYHCAALAHRTLGTPSGGAVRLSVGMYNKLTEAEQLCRIISLISKELVQ